MKFALTAMEVDHGPLSVAWEDGKLLGAPEVISRAKRLVKNQRVVQRGLHESDIVIADLTDGPTAYLTLAAAMRESGHLVGPIDFAGEDDDGLPLTFMPMPEAEHKVY